MEHRRSSDEIELALDLLGGVDLPPETQEMLGGVTRVASFDASTKVDRREYEVGVANRAHTMIVGGGVGISIALETYHKQSRRDGEVLSS